MDKEIGIIGLGKMGSGMAKNLAEKGWKVVGYNRTAEKTKKLEDSGIKGAYSFGDLVEKLNKPRVVWVMLPAGQAIDDTIFGTPEKKGIADFLDTGDIIVEGGNSFYKDTLRRGGELEKRGIKFIDVGVSGGPGGARNGACLMIGGTKELHEHLEPLFRDFAAPDAFRFFEGYGAGHFVKMIHNGIEYGMMQAIAEGFNILKKSEYNLNLKKAAEIYNNRSVIESRLVKWLDKAFEEHGTDLDEISGKVNHTGEGEWTVKTAKELGVDIKIIEESFRFRVQSENNPSYTGKVVSALRGQFGQHEVKKS